MPLLLRFAGVSVALACLWSAAAPAAETVRVGVLKYGPVNWEISIIQRHEMDVQHGFHLEVLELASDQATAVALPAGEVDIIVSDWLWGSRPRAEGKRSAERRVGKECGSTFISRWTPEPQ